jgi:hypothetical protein
VITIYTAIDAFSCVYARELRDLGGTQLDFATLEPVVWQAEIDR